MAAIDYLLTASDPFALFGLGRTFDVNLPELDARRDALLTQAKVLAPSDPDKATAVLAKVDDAHRVLADTVSRGRLLLDLLGGRGDVQISGLPPGFREQMASGMTAGWTDGERERLNAVASHQFRLLGSADNGVVKRERRRQIREVLNALAALDRPDANRRA